MTDRPRKPGPWAWRELLPVDEAEAVEYFRRARDAGYSRSVAGGFLAWCIDLVDGSEGPRNPSDSKYRKMLTELADAEKRLGQLVAA